MIQCFFLLQLIFTKILVCTKHCTRRWGHGDIWPRERCKMTAALSLWELKVSALYFILKHQDIKGLNLKNVLRESSQSQKITCCIWFHLHKMSRTGKSMNRKQISSSLGQGELRRNRKKLLINLRFYRRGDILKLIVVMVVQLLT